MIIYILTQLLAQRNDNELTFNVQRDAIFENNFRLAPLRKHPFFFFFKAPLSQTRLSVHSPAQSRERVKKCVCGVLPIGHVLSTVLSGDIGTVFPVRLLYTLKYRYTHWVHLL